MKRLLPAWWQDKKKLMSPTLQSEWALIAEFVELSPTRLELYPGYSPRFPVSSSLFLEPSSAREHLVTHGAKVSAEGGLPFPYPDHSLDLIGGFGVLGSVADPIDLLRDSLRVLQARGRALWSVPLGNWRDDAWDSSWGRVQRFSPHDITDLFSHAGFQVVRSATLPEPYWFRGWGPLLLPPLLRQFPHVAHSLYHEFRGSRFYRNGPDRWNGIAEQARWGLFLCTPERIAL